VTDFARQPQGQPTGGQFASVSRADSTVALLPHEMPAVGQEVIHEGRVQYVERVDYPTAMLRNTDGDLTLVSKAELGLNERPALTRDQLIGAAAENAAAEAETAGVPVVGTLSLVTASGTADADATLCVDHFDAVAIDEAVAAAPSDLTREWAVSSGNDATRCRICGAGVGRDPIEVNTELLAGIPDGDIAGYTWKAEQWSVERMRLLFNRDDVETALDEGAAARGINRGDHHSFDSDDFPKPIFGIELDPSEDLTWLGGADPSAE